MRTLVYCGMHDCATLQTLIEHFDIVYAFDANPDKVEAAHTIIPQPKVRKVFGALCDKDDGFVEFNITSKWDASSSIGTINPEFPHMKDPESALYDTDVRTIKAPCINLGNYLTKRNIHKIDLLITDLQGMDFTVIKTLAEWIEQGRITEIQCETEKDETPNIYNGVGSNKLKDFVGLLSKNYNLVEFKTEDDWWEGDTTWRLKTKKDPVIPSPPADFRTVSDIMGG